MPVTKKKQTEILSILTKYNVSPECYDSVAYAMNSKADTSKKVYLDNILLSDEEYAKLLNLYQEEPRLDTAMQTLSNYIGQSGKVYKSHYHTMTRGGWVHKRIDQEMPIHAVVTQPSQTTATNYNHNIWV